MGIFDKFKKKNEVIKQNEEKETPIDVTKEGDLDIVAMNNYMLTEIKIQDLTRSDHLSLAQLSSLSPATTSVVNTIKAITNQNTKATQTLYKITNLGKSDSLKAMKDGKNFWGAIKRKDGTSTMAKLQEVNVKNVSAPLDPTMLMMSVALAGVESSLGEIKEISTQIYSFLEHDKQAEIESDLEILNRSINDFKFNLENEKYLMNNHKQVMDIKRTSNKNMLFYQKELEDTLSKEKFFTTNNSMNSIIDEMQKKFGYYRLSLYIYSFSTFMEVLLLGNYQTSFLLAKQEELNELGNKYTNLFDTASDYVKRNANKSLEGGVLSGLGSAGKAIGTLAEKVNVKSVDNWLNEKGDNLKQSSQNFKNNFVEKFNQMKDSHAEVFRDQIEKLDQIYNKTQEIYFDDENLYLLP